ncbi:MAG: hypothetical protein WC028_09085 [Candidatus Obscuribacterales bacterium]|jgi:hypothetical protein
MNQSTYNNNYDQDLAIALGLDSDINIDFDSYSKSGSNSDRIMNPIIYLVSNLVKEFQADMVELSQKFRSASAKMSALIFMPENLLSSKNEIANDLQFSAILIEHPDTSLSFAPSPPVSMIKNSEDETKREEDETALIKMELQQQLLWFQEFGRHGLINTPSATTAELAQASGQITNLVTDLAAEQARNEPTEHTEKTKRHLTLITDHVQAA